MSFSLPASCYDGVNGGAYAPYADYLANECFPKAAIPVREVLDLGCGTGAICALLAKRGYDMTGLDSSLEMLSAAYERNAGLNTLLLAQDMREFELYGTVQAVYSSFDCLNYILTARDLKKVFALVRNYLEPGGIFAFDVNTLYRYKEVFDGRSYVYESGGDLLIWRSAASKTGSVCEFTLDFFTRGKDGSYERGTETQKQRFHSEKTLRAAAEGFELLEKSGGKGFDGCAANEKDYYVFRRIRK